MNKIIAIFLFFLLLGCGFNPIYSDKELDKNYNFSINTINFSGDNRINQNLKNNLIRFSNTENPIKYDLDINSSSKKTIITKNKKGNPEIFTMEILLNVNVYENNQIKIDQLLSKSFDYKNKSNKFELRKYENNIKKNLSKNLAQEIIQLLYSKK